MCVELDLARAVENGKGFFVAGAEGFVEPVEVFEEKPVVGENSEYEAIEAGHGG